MKRGEKVTIKPVEAILSLLDEFLEYGDIHFNYDKMSEYCGKKGKIRDVWEDYSSKVYKVILESDTEPKLSYWVWHVDWLIIEKDVLEGDEL